jgi:hypothetical protein
MEEFIVSKEELHKMFAKKEILDTNKGWYYRGKEVELIAIHQLEKKYLQDMMNADKYKIKLAN